MQNTILKKFKQNKFNVIHCLITAILSFIIIYFIILEAVEKINLFSFPYYQIDIAILCIFTIDYIIFFIKSKHKKNYIKNKILDLLCILSLAFAFCNNATANDLFIFLQIFAVYKIFTMIKVLIIIIFLKKKELTLSTVLNTNGFIYIIYTVITLIITCSIAISIFEHIPFEDSIWLSFVTCATVGYGDIIPQTVGGRAVSVVLMLAGVGLIGSFSSTLTTFFMNKKRNLNNKNMNKNNIKLLKITKNLTNNQIVDLISIAELMKSNKININIDAKK